MSFLAASLLSYLVNKSLTSALYKSKCASSQTILDKGQTSAGSSCHRKTAQIS